MQKKITMPMPMLMSKYRCRDFQMADSKQTKQKGVTSESINNLITFVHTIVQSCKSSKNRFTDPAMLFNEVNSRGNWTTLIYKVSQARTLNGFLYIKINKFVQLRALPSKETPKSAFLLLDIISYFMLGVYYKVIMEEGV